MKNRNYRFLLEGSFHASGKVLANHNHKPVKFSCSSCGKRSFVRYVDIRTGEYLPLEYGKCDHEGSCGNLVSPYKDGFAKKIWQQEWENKTDAWQPTPVCVPLKRELKFMPSEILKATLKNYQMNVFLQNLRNNVKYPFPAEDVEKVVKMYQLGTISKGYLKGGTTFPFIDKDGNVRVIQAKTFDAANHTEKTGNIHSLLDKHYGDRRPVWLEDYLKNPGFFTCLFGEHLLKEFPSNTVALVEAPKTAILGSLYFGFPEDSAKFLWMAVYNLSSLNYDRCKVLAGRNVVLFPDLSKNGNAYAKWKEKSEYFNSVILNSKFIVSDLLEKSASSVEREKGGDLADYFVMNDWKEFREKPESNQNNKNLYPLVEIFSRRNQAFKKLFNTFDLAVVK